ncbi:MAG: M28 family peptidase [Gemmataceae bacterium]
MFHGKPFSRHRLTGWVASIALAGLTTAAVAVDPAKVEPVKAEPKKLSAAELIDHKILDEVREHSEIMKNLGYISDTIGHRLTGSKSLVQANNYTADVMKSYGLENVHLEPWEIPIGWQRGFCNMKLVGPREMPLLACSAGWAPSTKGKVTGPVVVLDARTKEDLQKYKGKLKNAVVIQSPPTNVAPVTDNSYIGRPANAAPAAPAPAPATGAPATTPPGSPPKVQTSGGTKDEVDSPTDGTDEQPPAKEETKKEEPKAAPQPPAAQPPRGGAGGGRGGFGGNTMGMMTAVRDFLIEEGAAATLRDSGKPHGLLVTTGGWRGDDGKAPPDGVASLFVTHEHYAMLYRMAKEGKNPQVELEVKNTFIPGPVTCYNTVGEIRGSEKPDEFVVVGGHLDSWDLGSGTTDNGTGSCVTLEVARVLAKMAKEGMRPKRSIRFVLFSGEEQGLHGSKQYCDRHKDELSKCSLAIVHDTGTGKVLNFGVLGREEMRKVLAPELTTLKAVNFEGLVSGGMGGGTDHASFNAVGVPGMACFQEADEYRYTHHTQSDTFDKAKHPNLIQGAQVMAVTAFRTANLPDLLPRARSGGAGGGGGGGRPMRTPPTPPAPPPVAEKKGEEKKPPQ